MTATQQAFDPLGLDVDMTLDQHGRAQIPQRAAARSSTCTIPQTIHLLQQAVPDG